MGQQNMTYENHHTTHSHKTFFRPSLGSDEDIQVGK